MSATEPQVLARARADMARGELWRARDRLGGWVRSTGRYDPVVFGLLGDVHDAMGDRPQAGRWWLLAGRDVDDAGVASAVAAFRAACGGTPTEIARRLPRRIRLDAYPAPVRARLVDLGVHDETPGLPQVHPRSAPNRDPLKDAIILSALGPIMSLAGLVVAAVGILQVARESARRATRHLRRP